MHLLRKTNKDLSLITVCVRFIFQFFCIDICIGSSPLLKMSTLSFLGFCVVSVSLLGQRPKPISTHYPLPPSLPPPPRFPPQEKGSCFSPVLPFISRPPWLR